MIQRKEYFFKRDNVNDFDDPMRKIQKKSRPSDFL